MLRVSRFFPACIGTIVGKKNLSMSKRPISIDELLKDEQSAPVFISKSKRAKLKDEQIERDAKSVEIRSVPTFQHQSPSITVTHEKPNPSRIKRGRKKFQFDWDEQEDTSEDFRPLIESDSDEIDDILSKSQHWTTKSESEMNERDWRIFKEDYNINIKHNSSSSIPNPLRSWKSLDPKLISIIHNLNYHEPTPIQRASIPVALKLYDVLAIAETGSGKTLAYLLPLLNYILTTDVNFVKFEKSKNESLGLILVPTRELAIQITNEAEKFCQKLNLKVLSIIGGHQYNATINRIETEGVDIIVATPGRLVDSIERRILSLDKNYYLILDECDRMIDMGFEKDLNKIMANLPKSEKLNQTIDGKIFNLSKRQTMMFTATMSPQIETISNTYLKDPIRISIGQAGEALANIEQKFEYLHDEGNKLNKLIKLVQFSIKQGSIIIFANFKHIVDELSIEFESKGLDNVVIHGSKNQQQRESAIEKFRNQKVGILIATDVAARGIDIPNVSLVINYQMVKKFDEYIHRIGRTGRAGNLGKSYTFITDDDNEVFLPLKKYLVRGGIKLPDWLYNYKSATMTD